jgi:glycosyltransferase involved in cell wall biosynthesis
LHKKCNPAQARNIGVDNSTGRYVLFLDSDQVLSPTVVEECVEKGLICLIRLLEDPKLAKTLGSAGRTKMQNYRPEIVHAKLRKLYESSLSKSACKLIWVNLNNARIMKAIMVKV